MLFKILNAVYKEGTPSANKKKKNETEYENKQNRYHACKY